MALTTAMFTALSGMNVNSASLDVIGNNIANVNTTAFKSSRMLFASAYARTLSLGTPPGDVNGGTNPSQIGLGSTVAGTQRDFGGGTISATGNAHDLAIEGEGVFVIDRDGEQLFTRDGAFALNAEHDLVTTRGEKVQGYGVDESYAISDGELVDLNVPLGTLSLAEATESVRFSGNLNAAGEMPSQGTRIVFSGTDDDGLVAISGATPPPASGERISIDTRLVDIEDPALPGSGTPLFAAGQILEMNNAEKGGRVLPNVQLAIDATSTIQDLIDFLNLAAGTNTDAGTNPDGASPGVSLDAAAGTITLVGNTGTVNDVIIGPTDLRLLSTDGEFVRAPFDVDKQAAADGESVRTTFLAYDSLGATVEIDLAVVLESKSDSGTVWRYYVESADDTDAELPVATGTLSFNTDGQLTDMDPIEIAIDREDTGASTPFVIGLEFAGDSDTVTALASSTSEIAATFRDGAPLGTLSAYGVGADGTIAGTFTNGLTRTLGQVVLATFTNYEGLIDTGGGVYTVGPNSGSAVITTPGGSGGGRLVGGSLELSNVDLSEEFIGMILASTGYSASSRVIRTSDELVQQLIALTS